MAVDADAPEVLSRFNAGLGLVDSYARQVHRSTGGLVDFDDLQSCGREGLLDAARRFDASRGVPFRGYAALRVRGAIVDGVRQMAELPRRVHERLRATEAVWRVSDARAEDVQALEPAVSRPEAAERALREHLAAMATAAALGLLSEVAIGDDADPIARSPEASAEEQVAHAELLDQVRAAIDELPDAEATLLRRHYFEGERFDRVAEELGLSKSWASRLHARAIKRLTVRLGPSQRAARLDRA